MATRLRLPTLFDVVVVDDPREMDWFERDPGITREIAGTGSWLHHLIRSRIQRTLTVDATPLPVFSGQGIGGRAIQQEKLESRLSDSSTAPLLDPDAMQALARYVAGGESGESAGVAAQQVVGRMFISTYTASPESYAAAKRVDAAIKAGPVRALWWRWSGQLALSRQLLWALAQNDPQCIHATSIAVHGIVDSLARMRTTLLRDARRRDVLAPDHAASTSLVAPRLLLRSCSRHVQAPFLRGPLAPGTLVVFRLRKMHAGTGDDGLALASDRWNRCPAHSIVPKLLGEVWTAARQEWTQLRYTQYRPSAFVRLSGRGFEALNRVIPWHRLPTPLGLANLTNLRVMLRARNLHNPPTGSAPGTGCPAWTPQVRSARTADGTYNDLADPAMGSAGTCFGRNVPLASVRVEPEPALLLPNPRQISRRLMTRYDFIPARSLNVLAAAWIQFQVHDWFSHRTTKHERPFEVQIEADDHTWRGERPMRVDRTERHDPGRPPDGPPAFANSETHWWDASQLYGSSLALQHPLRAWQDGKLRVESDGRLPCDQETGLEIAGFDKNWWVGLSLMHSLFTLEHNAICDGLRAEHPGWDDEQLFSTARLVNAALIAKIHSLEWTPAILGHPTVRIGMHANWWGFVGERLQRLVGRLGEWDVLWGIPGSTADHHSAPYAITEEFVSIYRMHPLMPDTFTFFSVRDGSMLEAPDQNGSARPVKRDLAGVVGLNTPSLRASVATADLLYSLGIAHPGAITLHNYPKALQQLERPGNRREPPEPPLDLAAVDILRDRERGVPRYNAFRTLLHLPPVRTFEELSPRWAAELRAVYEHVDRIDLMVGLFAEEPPKGCGFSDTAFRVFVLMASRRLKSDRFFTTDYTPAVYTQTGLDWIARTEMKDVLLRHYPALAPAIQRVANAFAPWDRVAAAP